jgi:hypothetical protein
VPEFRRFARRKKLALAAGTSVLVLVGGALVPTGAVGEETHLARLAKWGEQLQDMLGPTQESALSAGGLSLIQISKHFSRFDFRDLSEEEAALARVRPAAPRTMAPGEVSDPFAAEDFASRLLGMTQSEVSAARCGRTVTMGFNDSGSFAATAFLGVNPNGSLAFQGWSRSTDGGATYVDKGALFARSLPASVLTRDLFGDPVLGCTSERNVYYATLAVDRNADGSVTSGIAVSRSLDGAATFPRTFLAAGESAENHALDKPWMAVEPGATATADDDVLHLTYTDFGAPGSSAACGGDSRTAIEYVRSTDGGRTWGAPRVIEEVCGDRIVQGSQVEVGLDDAVHVAWQHWDSFPTPSDIRIRRSTNLGSSFAAAHRVDRVTPIGDGFAVQGNFRTFIALQGLAVDTTASSSRGTVYVTWHDGRFRSQPDPLGACAGARYCFGDALLARSPDGGSQWSSANRVNTDDILRGVDQVFPAVDVDATGAVWVGFYDRRRDTRNLMLDMYVARSTDRGATWTNTRATRSSFAPVTGWQDLVVNPSYMGDYLAVAADRMGAPGVVVAWGDNSRGDANVLERRF